MTLHSYAACVFSTITGATSEETTQIFLPIKIQHASIWLNCLVVKNLIRPLIIGEDLLRDIRANIDLETNKFGFEFDYHSQIVDFDTCHVTQYLAKDAGGI